MSEQLAPQTLGQIVQTAVTHLEAEGLTYGSYFPMSRLKELAGVMGHDETKFAFFKMAMIGVLRERGFWLSEKGLSGEGMRVAAALENFHYGESAREKAVNALDRAMVLLTNTDLTGLSEAESKRHQNILHQIQHQRLMLLRSEEAAKILQKHKPTLLQKDIEISAEKVES